MARQLDSPRLPRLHRLSLQLLLLSTRLGHLLLLRIRLDALQEVLARAGQAHVLDAYVDALLEVAVADWLVENHADGGFGDVVDDAGLAVVVFVWHTLLYGSVADYVDDISDFVLLEIDGHMNATRLLETSCKGISGTRSETF